MYSAIQTLRNLHPTLWSSPCCVKKEEFSCIGVKSRAQNRMAYKWQREYLIPAWSDCRTLSTASSCLHVQSPLRLTGSLAARVFYSYRWGSKTRGRGANLPMTMNVILKNFPLFLYNISLLEWHLLLKTSHPQTSACPFTDYLNTDISPFTLGMKSLSTLGKSASVASEI